MTVKKTGSRRQFLSSSAALVATGLTGAWHLPRRLRSENLFELSLSHWSFHRAIFGDSRSDYDWFIRTLHKDPDLVLQGTMDPRDLAVRARVEFDLGAVDYANVLFFGHATDEAYLADMKQRADDHDVKSTVLMCDELGRIGDHDADLRTKAVESHFPWIDAAARLGCSSVRVNAYGSGTQLAQLEACAESLNRLADYAADRGIDVLVENHGFLSSNGAWLAMLMQKADHPSVGVVADFDNFFMSTWGETPVRWYDRYQGMHDIAPYARFISSKAHAFDEQGEETSIDYARMMRIILDTGFRGFVGVEYEGDGLTETEGIRRTKELLVRVRNELTTEYY